MKAERWDQYMMPRLEQCLSKIKQIVISYFFDLKVQKRDEVYRT